LFLFVFSYSFSFSSSARGMSSSSRKSSFPASTFFDDLGQTYPTLWFTATTLLRTLPRRNHVSSPSIRSPWIGVRNFPLFYLSPLWLFNINFHNYSVKLFCNHIVAKRGKKSFEQPNNMDSIYALIYSFISTISHLLDPLRKHSPVYCLFFSSVFPFYVAFTSTPFNFFIRIKFCIQVPLEVWTSACPAPDWLCISIRRVVCCLCVLPLHAFTSFVVSTTVTTTKEMHAFTNSFYIINFLLKIPKSHF